jgi:hypothetical protein
MATERNGNARRGPRSKREAQKYTFGDDHATDLLLALVIGTALAGGAMRVGLTRDGGALSIGVYAYDEYGTEYVRPGEDLAEELRKIADGWQLPLAAWDDDKGEWIVI